MYAITRLTCLVIVYSFTHMLIMLTVALELIMCAVGVVGGLYLLVGDSGIF
jgi:hypothetical protein